MNPILIYCCAAPLLLASAVAAQPGHAVTISNTMGTMTVTADEIAYKTATVDTTISRDLIAFFTSEGPYRHVVDDVGALLKISALTDGLPPLPQPPDTDSLYAALDSLHAAVALTIAYLDRVEAERDRALAAVDGAVAEAVADSVGEGAADAPESDRLEYDPALGSAVGRVSDAYRALLDRIDR